jgi:hypothetical protein
MFVVAGEDSREKVIMADRATKLPAASYPTASHVPPTPAEPVVKVCVCVSVCVVRGLVCCMCM